MRTREEPACGAALEDAAFGQPRHVRQHDDVERLVLRMRRRDQHHREKEAVGDRRAP